MMPAVLQFVNTSDYNRNLIFFNANYQKNCQLQFLTLRSINFNSLQCHSVAHTVIEFSRILDS